MVQTYKAYLASRGENNKVHGAIVTRSLEKLPPGDVLIKVRYSSLNYKDALSATGAPGVTKDYPHVPGIDAAGIILESNASHLQPGSEVLVTGYDLGVNTDGGYAEYIRVPADWVVPLPQGLTLKESMMLGTAGFTAALCVQSLLRNEIKPENGEVLVTGATGGVGSIAVALLAKLGFTVVASTGKHDAHDYLKSLGVASIIDRTEMNDQPDRPLMKMRWAAAIDTVGGSVLTAIVKSLKLEGSVAAVGVVAGPKLELTVFPFILRGVRLLGVDSALCSKSLRMETWRKLANEWKLNNLGDITTTIPLEKLDDAIAAILKGNIQGRTVVAID